MGHARGDAADWSDKMRRPPKLKFRLAAGKRKRSRAPVRAPCPVTLGGLVVRLRVLVAGPELMNLAVGQIGDFRQQKQVARVEAA